MLDHPCLEPGGLDQQRLAVDVEAADPRVQRPLDVDGDPGQAEAALLGAASSSEIHSISGLTSAVGGASARPGRRAAGA